MSVELPELPTPEGLAHLCRETASREGVAPELVEKDFYLTRILWSLGQELGEAFLLKGGTLLSKVDLGFLRMSEDVDLVLPGEASRLRGTNARRLHTIRDALKRVAPQVGARLPFPGGHFQEGASHGSWTLQYDSVFGEPTITVEAAIRPVLSPRRRVRLGQLLRDPLAGDYAAATCMALDAGEARAEKVRAAFTRTAIRDFYDLEQLLNAGEDFSSTTFVELVNRKLAELDRPPLREQPPSFGLSPVQISRLKSVIDRELRSVLRSNAPVFNLDRVLARFNALWSK